MTQVRFGVQSQHRPLGHWHCWLAYDSFLVWKLPLLKSSSQLSWDPEKHIWLGLSVVFFLHLGQSCKVLLAGMERASSKRQAFCLQPSPPCSQAYLCQIQAHLCQTQALAVLEHSRKQILHLRVSLQELLGLPPEFLRCFSGLAVPSLRPCSAAPALPAPSVKACSL